MSKEQSLHGWRQKLPDKMKSVGSGMVVLILVIGGFWGSHYFAPGHADSNSHDTLAKSTPISSELMLTRQKVASAGIRVAEVACVELQRTKTVTATIDYDATRHLSVKAPVDCVVERWFVKPGQTVTKGEPLVVLSGAEVALARAETKKCAADVRIAQINFDWSQETQNNLTELLSTLKTLPSLEEVEAQFDGKLLGEHRDHLLTTYTRYVLASSVAKRAKPLGEQGIVAGSTAEARLSQRDIAATEFKSACEQSEFEGRQNLARARADLELAQQKLAVAQERLRLLLGPLADQSPAGAPGDFEVRAPFDARVELLQTSPASLLSQSDPILTLADTTKLWVSALIHQHDWDALQVAATETLRVSLPAIPQEVFFANVSFIGPEVSATTRAVSLVAELDNKDGRLRPGMFAWVALPMESARMGLVVPTSAIQRHDSLSFVFVADGETRFRRVDVATGIETPEYVEITQGLSEGQKVVDRGTFFLKSELLLEQEEE